MVQHNILGICVAAIVSLTASSVSALDCDIGWLDIKSGNNVSRFSVEIADTFETRATGLMNRDYLAPFAGMLFIYDSEKNVSFWMKNTLISLDMLFIDETGMVLRIHENAIPLDLTQIPGGDGVQYVLEINGGMTSMLNIEVGAQIKHPEIDADLAIWPCGE